MSPLEMIINTVLFLALIFGSLWWAERQEKKKEYQTKKDEHDTT